MIEHCNKQDGGASDYINGLILKDMGKTPDLLEALQSIKRSQWKCPACRMYFKIGGKPKQALCPRCDVDMDMTKEEIPPEPPKEEKKFLGVI